jgi:hypothetical protein
MAHESIHRNRSWAYSLCRVLVMLPALWAGVGCSESVTTGPISEKLFNQHPGVLRGDFTGSVGCGFVVGDDQDRLVTHLGFYDRDGDGLNLDHHVALYEAGEKPEDVALIASAKVPWGRSAIFQDGYRWVELPEPSTLEAGGRYILVAEVITAVKDPWPDRVCPRTVAISGKATKPDACPKWNEFFVGNQSESSRLARWSRDPWPAVPNVERTKGPNASFGAANLGFGIAAD